MPIGGLNSWVGGIQGDHGWTAGSVLVNPTDGTVLVVVSGIGAGNYLFAVSGFGTVAWTYDIQLQDSGGGVVTTQRRNPIAGTDDFLFPNKVTVPTNGQVKLILRGNITGSTQMSIFYQEVG